MRQIWVIVLVFLLGLSLGLVYAWRIIPVEYIDNEIADLKAPYQVDYVLMVSDAYALSGNLDAARERLSRLAVPDVAALVLSQGATETEIGHLARLAAALGASSPALSPYLTPTPTVP
jgi:hypothetical protein